MWSDNPSCVKGFSLPQLIMVHQLQQKPNIKGQSLLFWCNWMYLYLILWPHHKLDYQLLSNFPNIFMVTKITFPTQLLKYLKGWAQLKSLKPLNTPPNIAPFVDFPVCFCIFSGLEVFVIFVAGDHFTPLTLPLSGFRTVLESSCHSKGRVIPGRQHHHTTPLLNRQQKITSAFQPQQQQPIGFGQVTVLTTYILFYLADLFF